VSHCGDFLFEDMFRDFRAEWTETSIYVEDYTRRVTVEKLRLMLPQRVERITAGHAQLVVEAHPSLRAKATAVCDIVAAQGARRGVLFFRFRRLLDVFMKLLKAKGIDCCFVHGMRSTKQNDLALREFRSGNAQLLLITRDTGKRGLDLPEADYAVFYSPKSREDVTWQEVSRIRSTTSNKKDTYILNYAETAESDKADRMFALFLEQPRSIAVRRERRQ
jgi:ERCC4-related helicase